MQRSRLGLHVPGGWLHGAAWVTWRSFSQGGTPRKKQPEYWDGLTSPLLQVQI